MREVNNMNSDISSLRPSEQVLFRSLIAQVGAAIGRPFSSHQGLFEWDDVRLELIPTVWEQGDSAVLFVFTLTGFKVVDAATLANMLHRNRNLLQSCALPACFCLDETGLHAQFQQRMRLDYLPVWVLERYINDSLAQLRELFVVSGFSLLKN